MMLMNPMDRLMWLRKKDSRLIVGLMSGTSVDGVSLVLVRVWGCGLSTKFKIIAYRTYPYPPEIRTRIFELFDRERSDVEKICFMNFILGEFYADMINAFLDQAGFNPEDVDLIASHGQTIYHIPHLRELAGYRTRSTLQIGEPCVIAERTGLPVVADFRPRDIAAGGHGAPIIAYVDYIIFRSVEKSRAVQNIGGIANVTYLPKNCSVDDVVAFDTGPGNMIIDAVVRRMTNGALQYDVDGKIALKGKVSRELLDWLLRHPFIRKRPPKTTGREEFGEDFVERVMSKASELGLSFEDIVATVTAFTVESIVYNYRTFLGEVDEVILGGGGAYNLAIVRGLRDKLKIPILTHEDFGIPEQAKEPLGMALLANETIMGNPNNVPRATGARKRIVMGKIIL